MCTVHNDCGCHVTPLPPAAPSLSRYRLLSDMFHPPPLTLQEWSESILQTSQPLA